MDEFAFTNVKTRGLDKVGCVVAVVVVVVVVVVYPYPQVLESPNRAS